MHGTGTNGCAPDNDSGTAAQQIGCQHDHEKRPD